MSKWTILIVAHTEAESMAEAESNMYAGTVPLEEVATIQTALVSKGEHTGAAAAQLAGEFWVQFDPEYTCERCGGQLADDDEGDAHHVDPEDATVWDMLCPLDRTSEWRPGMVRASLAGEDDIWVPKENK